MNNIYDLVENFCVNQHNQNQKASFDCGCVIFFYLDTSLGCFKGVSQVGVHSCKGGVGERDTLILPVDTLPYTCL